MKVGRSIFPSFVNKKKKKQKGSGWWHDFKRNTHQGYKETRDLIKQNKALQYLLNRSDRPGEYEDNDDDGLVTLVGLGKAVALETDKRIKSYINKAKQRYRRRGRR